MNMATVTVTNSTTPESAPQAQDPTWVIFTQIMDIFSGYVSVPIFLFGITGNILSCCIFFLTRNQDRASSGYLGPLGFFDFWNNCIGVYYWLVTSAPRISNGRFGRPTYGESDWGCYVGWIFNTFGMYMSGFIIVLFSAERCLAIWFPLKMAPILTPELRRKAILSLLLALPLYSVFLCTHYGYFHGDETTIKGCPVRPGTPFLIQLLFVFVNIGLGSLIPCITLVLVLNILLLIGLRRGNRQMDHAKSDKEDKTSQERRCLRNLMLVSCFYVIFMTPHGVFWAWTSSADGKAPKVHSLALYSLIWCGMNYCINPLLYCYSLPYYRETAIKVLSCGYAGRNKSKSKPKL